MSLQPFLPKSELRERVQVVDPGSVQDFLELARSVEEGPINGGSLEFSPACFSSRQARSTVPLIGNLRAMKRGTYRGQKGSKRYLYLLEMETL